MLSRRDLGKLALLSNYASAAKKIDSVVDGVRFGVQSYIFSGLGLPPDGVLDIVIHSMVESGLGECDLFAPLVEPARFWDRIRAGGPGAPSSPEVLAARNQAHEELAQWRKSVSLDYFRAIRRKFEDAGIDIYGLSGFPGATEEELRWTFDVADTVGARLVTLNIPFSAAKRVAPLADQREFLVGIQGHPDMHVTDLDVIAKPEQFAAAVQLSKNYCMSFDIGDATGGGYDSLKFVETHHDHIHLLYLKDRRKDRLSVPWGEGDTPIKEILRLVRDRKYPIRCFIDCDYKTTNRPADVKRSFEYAKAALR
jgi:sugar phosphate isomerase/epimerase